MTRWELNRILIWPALILSRRLLGILFGLIVQQRLVSGLINLFA